MRCVIHTHTHTHTHCINPESSFPFVKSVGEVFSCCLSEGSRGVISSVFNTHAQIQAFISVPTASKFGGVDSGSPSSR